MNNAIPDATGGHCTSRRLGLLLLPRSCWVEQRRSKDWYGSPASGMEVLALVNLER